MPKPFSITIDVELEYVGKTVRALNNMDGVSHLHFDLDEEKKKTNGSGKPRVPFKKFDQTGEEYIAGILFKHAHPTRVLMQHFADAGRSPKSINSQLSEMKKTGLIKLQDDGTWMLTKKGRDRQRHKAK